MKDGRLVGVEVASLSVGVWVGVWVKVRVCVRVGVGVPPASVDVAVGVAVRVAVGVEVAEAFAVRGADVVEFGVVVLRPRGVQPGLLADVGEGAVAVVPE